jgi:hypothetical protein
MFWKRGDNKKGAIAIDKETLAYWFIAMVVAAIVILGYVILRSKGVDAIEYVKNLLRFGR